MHLLSILSITTTYVISLVQATPTDHSVLRFLDSVPVIHFTIARRHGAFVATVGEQDYVDLDHLVRELETTESRFNTTKRVVKGNKLVRKAKTSGAGSKKGIGLMGDIASTGAWCAPYPIKSSTYTFELTLSSSHLD